MEPLEKVAAVAAVNILLVDDREDNLIAFNAVLRSAEFHLVNATSGEQALGYLETMDFAVVLLDVLMPGMDGLETARRIRAHERSRTTPIILVTGTFPDEEHIRLGYEVGAVDFISKPFDPRVMKSKVAVFVDLYRKAETIRRQEKLLHEASESRFRTIFEQSPLAIQLFSPLGELVEANRAWERLAAGPDTASTFDEPTFFGEAVKRALDGVPSEFPALPYRNRWVEAFVYPVRNERGAIREVVVILKDVTDRRAVEEDLRSSRDQLQIIFERVKDSILVQDVEGICVYCNEGGARLLGQPSAEAAIGKSIAQSLTGYDIFDQDGKPVPFERLPSRQALRGAHKSPEAILRIRDRATARETWWIASSRPVLDQAGKPHLAVTIYRNITEQRRMEENERFLADATATLASSLDYRETLAKVAKLAIPRLADSFSVWVANEQGELAPLVEGTADCADASLGVAQVFRSRKPQMLNSIGNEALRWAMGREGAPAQQIAQFERMRTLGFHSLIHAPIQVRDRALGVLSFLSLGDSRRYDSVDLALAEELGRRAGMAIENSRLYAEAQSQRERLQKAVQARDEFISIASHELKTPVTSLLLHAEMATLQLDREPRDGDGARGSESDPDNELRERIRRFVSISSSQIDRISRLIDEMLDVSRLGIGKLAMEFEAVDLGRLVLGLLRDFSEQLREAGVEVAFEESSAAVVRCDRFRIEQVMTNLITNAMKYGAGKPMRVSMGRDGDVAWVKVADEGIGIAPEHHGRIFERFERAVSPTAVSGLGLGLFIVKQIVEAHGGWVTVESALGKGACFTVSLPIGGQSTH